MTFTTSSLSPIRRCIGPWQIVILHSIEFVEIFKLPQGKLARNVVINSKHSLDTVDH